MSARSTIRIDLSGLLSLSSKTWTFARSAQALMIVFASLVKSSMETISLRGVFGASFNRVGMWLEVAKTTVRCAWLILKDVSELSPWWSNRHIYIYSVEKKLAGKDEVEEYILTNRVSTQSVVKTDSNLVVTLQGNVDDLPFWTR